MAKPIIDNYKDLMEEKKRLKAQLNLSKANIKNSFQALKNEVNPLANFKRSAYGDLLSDSANPLIKFGIKRSSEFLIGKVLLKRAGWLPRLIIPFIVREVATRLIGSKVDKKIASTLHNAADKIRDADIPNISSPQNT